MPDVHIKELHWRRFFIIGCIFGALPSSYGNFWSGPPRSIIRYMPEALRSGCFDESPGTNRYSSANRSFKRTLIDSISSTEHRPIFLTKRSSERATIWNISAALSEVSPFCELFSMPTCAGTTEPPGSSSTGPRWSYPRRRRRSPRQDANPLAHAPVHR